MNYEFLSRYRSALMGLAMIFVMFFHVPMAKGELMYGVVRLGNIGVDMFLFLSGIGLWFSWTKSQPRKTLVPSKIASFYRKRVLRIYPAWLIIACLYYIPDFFGTDLFGQFHYATGADWHSTKSPDVFHLVANILVNWSFWRIDDGAFWFVPSILAMYLFAPFYMELIRRHPVYRWMPVVAMVWATMVQYMPPIHDAVGHIEIFWSRIPIFLIGINCGELVKQKREIEPSAIWLLLITFGLSLWMCIEFENHWRGHFPLFLERMVYIPLSISCMMLVCKALSWSEERGARSENQSSAPTGKAKRNEAQDGNLTPRSPLPAPRGFLSFIGGISLEIYLVHAQFVLRYLTPLQLGYLPTFLLLVAISLPLAWLLKRLTECILP